MKFGLSEQHFSLLDNLVISPLKEAGASVWVFGSRARGDHRTFSDVDLLFELDDLPPGLLGKIKESIEESRIPYKIDLVNIKDLASSYQASVFKDRVKV